jgi:hypothetical protein
MGFRQAVCGNNWLRIEYIVGELELIAYYHSVLAWEMFLYFIPIYT